MECDKYVPKILIRYQFGTFWSHTQIDKKTIGSVTIMTNVPIW